MLGSVSGVMSMLHHVPAVATTWMNHGRKKMSKVVFRSNVAGYAETKAFIVIHGGGLS